MLTPQFQGMEGKLVVKYRLKNANVDESFSNNTVFITNYGDTMSVIARLMIQTVSS